MKAISNNTIILFLAALIGCQSSNSTKKLDIEQRSLTQNKNINNEPNSEGLRYFMNGQMLMNQGDFAMAIIELQQALIFDPKVSPIHTAIAECYWNIGKPELAKKHSDDKKSGANGGELDWFGVSNKVNMYESFSDASFQLSSNGDISPPTESEWCADSTEEVWIWTN